MDALTTASHEPDLQPRRGLAAGPARRRAAATSSAPSERLSSRLAHDLRQMVLDGRYKPGDRLPSEKALAEEFRVSRGVVREALKGLESAGLVQIRRGASGGAFVRRVSLQQLNEALYTLLRLEGFQASSLHEARLLLEPGIAALATERMTPLGLSELERTAARAEAALREGRPIYTAIDLHNQLARLTGNPILELLVGFLTDLLETSRLLHLSPIDTSRQAGEEIVRQHRAILAAIARHDPARAEALMREHLLAVSRMEAAGRPARSG